MLARREKLEFAIELFPGQHQLSSQESRKMCELSFVDTRKSIRANLSPNFSCYYLKILLTELWWPHFDAGNWHLGQKLGKKEYYVKCLHLLALLLLLRSILLLCFINAHTQLDHSYKPSTKLVIGCNVYETQKSSSKSWISMLCSTKYSSSNATHMANMSHAGCNPNLPWGTDFSSTQSLSSVCIHMGQQGYVWEGNNVCYFQAL